MSEREQLASVIRSVTDRWDEPLDEVHDVPQIVNAIIAAGWSPTAANTPETSESEPEESGA